MAPYSLKFCTGRSKRSLKTLHLPSELEENQQKGALKVKLPMMCLLLLLPWSCSLRVFLLRGGTETADGPTFASSLKPPDQ